MAISKHDMIKLAKHFNKSHHYEHKAQVAPHHFKEDMRRVEAKARADMMMHRQKRRENDDKAGEE